MGRLVIYGAGGFGREVLRSARHTAISRPDIEGIVFADDHRDRVGTQINGVPVIASSRIHADDWCVIAVNKPGFRRQIADRCPRFISVVGPTASIYDGVGLGAGAVVTDYCLISADEQTQIGAHFHINTHSAVGHDCTIGDFVTVGPHVGVSGNVIIEDDVHIGCGASIMNGRPDRPLRIGAGAIIGIGSVVMRSVPAGTTVFGNPAKVVKRPAHTAPVSYPVLVNAR